MSYPWPALQLHQLTPQQAAQPQWQQAIAALVAPYQQQLSPPHGLQSPQLLAQQALAFAPYFWVAVEADTTAGDTLPAVWAASYAEVDGANGTALVHGVSRAMPNTSRPYKHPFRREMAHKVLQALQAPALGLRLVMIEMDDPCGKRRNLGALGFCRQYGFRPVGQLVLPLGVRLPEPSCGCALWGLLL